MLHSAAVFPQSCCAMDVRLHNLCISFSKKEEKVILSSSHAVFKKQRAKSHKVSLYIGSKQQQCAKVSEENPR